MTRRGGITADELVAELRSDPEWVAKESERERRRKELELTIAKAESPIVTDLRRHGVSVRSVSELVNTNQPYPKAIPVLLEHLKRPYPPAIREFVARALGVREARDQAWDDVIDGLAHEGEPQVQDGLFVAISGMAKPSDLDVLIRLIRRVELGPSRIFLISNLRRSKRPEARAALLELRDDPELGQEVRRRMSVQ